MRIGIIGSSSQVGASLAFYLKHFTPVEPICFTRSPYSNVFFERCGLDHRELDLRETESLRSAFAGLNGVIDCTYPAGQLYEIPRQIEKNLSAIIPALPAGSCFIYMSTIMAFGMPTGYKKVEHFAIPRTTYSFIKRKAEKLTERLSRQNNIRGYNFRLGQVHGFLQSVNSSYREKLSGNKSIVLDGEANDLVNIIFIPTLAEAVIKAVGNQITPGLYSLVNNPQWTLQQLYQYYQAYYGFSNELMYCPTTRQPLSGRLKSGLSGSARRWRPLLESYLLMRNENLYRKVKGRYRVAEMSRNSNSQVNGYADFHLLGANPGKLVNGAGAAPASVLEQEKKMESLYNAFLEMAPASSI